MLRLSRIVRNICIIIVFLFTFVTKYIVYAAPEEAEDGKYYESECYSSELCEKTYREEVDFARERIRVFGMADLRDKVLISPLIISNNGSSYLYSHQGTVIVPEWQLPYCYDDHGLFDAEKYANDNPDLLQIYGYDREKLWQHYKTLGVYEGRRAYALNDEANAALLIIDVAEQITNANMTSEQKVKAVHDWIIMNISFDNGELGDYNDPAFYFTGAMLSKKAVCRGYASTFESFMNILGVYCEVVGTDTENHAWNRVLIDGEWRYIDVTWDDDDNRNGNISYNYYMLTYREMNMRHPNFEKIVKLSY